MSTLSLPLVCRVTLPQTHQSVLYMSLTEHESAQSRIHYAHWGVHHSSYIFGRGIHCFKLPQVQSQSRLNAWAYA
jgi:hypothetical protein